jgi:hypothetical protein
MNAKKMTGILSLLLLIVLVSGCTDNIFLSTLKLTVVDSAVEQISVIAEVPAFVREGKTMTCNILLNPETYMQNLSVSIYDASPFLTLEEGQANEWIVPYLETNRTRTFQTRYVAKETEFDQEIELKFLVEYTSNMSASEGITILDEFEYEDKYSKGTLGEISHNSFESESPLNIKISFDEGPPFINDSRVLMYIDYSYAAEGIIDSLDTVEIVLPQNLKYKDCPDYDLVGKGPIEKEVVMNWQGDPVVTESVNVGSSNLDITINSVTTSNKVDLEINGVSYTNQTSGSEISIGRTKVYFKDVIYYGTNNAVVILTLNLDYSTEDERTLVLNKEKKFINKKSVQSSCELETLIDNPISTGTIELSADYTYRIAGQAEIELRKR